MNTPALPENEISDADLVHASLQGDTSSFATLVRRHQNLVTGIAYSVLGRRAAAEDVAQEAFVAAWRQLATLHDPARVRAWLVGIARNLALNRLRVQQRDSGTGSEISTDNVSPEPSPDDEAMLREEEAIVDLTLRNLPEEYREVLILYYREEHSTAAVAEALALSEDAVRQRLVRGRRLLQERVLSQVERTLRRTGPGAAFAIAVIALLPAPPAAAAGVGAGIATLPIVSSVMVGAAAASVGAYLGELGALIGFLSGTLGSYVGVKSAFAMSRNETQRRVLVVAAWQFGTLAVAEVVVMCAVTFNFRRLFGSHIALGVLSLLLLNGCYGAVLFIMARQINTRFRQAAPREAGA